MGSTYILFSKPSSTGNNWDVKVKCIRRLAAIMGGDIFSMRLLRLVTFILLLLLLLLLF